MKSTTFQIYGSHGIMTVNRITGVVESCSTGVTTESDQSYRLIDKFDVAEYRKHYGTEIIPGAVDILDMGYWKTEKGQTSYEEPAHDWRKETAEMRDGTWGEYFAGQTLK